MSTQILSRRPNAALAARRHPGGALHALCRHFRSVPETRVPRREKYRVWWQPWRLRGRSADSHVRPRSIRERCTLRRSIESSLNAGPRRPETNERIHSNVEETDAPTDSHHHQSCRLRNGRGRWLEADGALITHATDHPPYRNRPRCLGSGVDLFGRSTRMATQIRSRRCVGSTVYLAPNGWRRAEGAPQVTGARGTRVRERRRYNAADSVGTRDGTPRGRRRAGILDAQSPRHSERTSALQLRASPFVAHVGPLTD